MNKCGLIPDAAGYSASKPAQVLYSNMDGGRPRGRLNFLGTYHDVMVSWTVGKDGYNYLMQMNRWSEANGCPPFLIDLVIDSADLVEYEATIVSGTLKLASTQGHQFTVNAQLSVKPASNQAATFPSGYGTNSLLRIVGNGALNSTAFPDSSIYNRSVAVFGNTKVQGAVKIFGDNCGYVDGAGDYLEVDFGTRKIAGDLTVQMMIYHDGAPSGNQAYFTIDGLDYELYNRSGSGNKLTWYMGSNRIIGTTTIANNAARHISLTRQSGVWKAFYNGNLEGSYDPGGAVPEIELGLCRFLSYGAGSEQYKGYFAFIEVIDGKALYTANFTPPVQGYF